MSHRAIRNKKLQAKKNIFKLKKFQIILQDIALYPKLIPPQYIQSFKQQLKQVIESSCIDIHKNLSNNIQLSKQNVQKINIQNNHFIKKKPLKNVSTRKSRKKDKTYKSELSSEDIKSTKVLKDNECNEIVKKKSVRNRWRAIIDSDDESSTVASFEISNKISCVPKKAISTNTEVLQHVSTSAVSRKSKLYMSQDVSDHSTSDLTYGTCVESIDMSSDDTVCLDKKNLFFNDCNSKTQETSNEEVFNANTKCNYNLTRVNFINGENHRVQQKCSTKNRKRRISTDIESDFSTSKSFKNITTVDEVSNDTNSSNILLNVSDDNVSEKRKQHNIRTKSNDSTIPAVDLKSTAIVPKTAPIGHFVEDNLSKTCNNSLIKGQTVPKIIQDTLLPKGTIPLVRLNDVSASNSISKDSNVKQNQCNNRNKNIRRILDFDDTLKCTPEILGEKEDRVSPKINKLINASKISECILTSKSSIQDNTLDNNGLDKKVSNCKSSNSLTKTESNIHNDININDSSIKPVINSNCSIYDQVSNRKRTVEEESKDTNTHVKRSKLDRSYPKRNRKQNMKSLSQQLKDSSDTDTTSEKKDAESDKIDLRKILDRKRSERACKSDAIDNKTINKDDKIIGNTVNKDGDKIINNTTDNTISMEINNINSIIAVTNIVKNEEINEKFSLKKISTFNENLHEKQNNDEISSPCNSDYNSDTYLSDDLYDPSEETDTNTCEETDTNICEDTNTQNKCKDDVKNNNDCNNKEEEEEEEEEDDDDDDDDDDRISLFATETFDISQYDDMFPDSQEKLSKSSYSISDKPYRMTASSFNKYLKQNTNEFNQEYERCMENNIKKLQIIENRRCMENSIKKSQIIENSTENKDKKTEAAENSLPKTCSENKLLTVEQTVPKITTNTFLLKKTIPDKQSEQTSHIYCPPASSANFTLSAVENRQSLINYNNIQHCFHGFCFSALKNLKCNRNPCHFKHDLQNLVNSFQSIDSGRIMYTIEYAKSKGYYLFCQNIYRISLIKFNIDQILTAYKMLYEMHRLTEDITCDTIKELLLNRKMPLKTVAESIIKFIYSFTQPYVSILRNRQNYQIFKCIERFVIPGEYWYIAKSMLSIITPDKNIVENILRDCISNKKLSDVQDINDMLLSKLHPGIMSQLDEHLMMSFKSLLTEKIAKDTSPVTLVEDFGQNYMEINTIASPDSKQSSYQTESPKSITVTNKNQANGIIKCDQEANAIDSRPYVLQPIDDLPEPRSIYRNHKNLWKFYLDLDGVQKGLEHEDYDHVIEILKRYTAKQDADYFIRSCCSMIRAQIKRSDHHLKNIIQRTVQTGTFAALRKILFDLGVDILVALVDEEAWRLALYFVESLKICDLPSNAEFTMLSAEIYLANKKILEALDLFKNKNIICTSRAKWRVASTVHDEYVRNKLIYILLDSLCNGLVDHAFYLFTFLLKDQSSQFYPIDLSRYVDKLTVLLLSKNEIALITEMANLILKYNFPLIMNTCRALITTIIHIEEKLAMQLFYYAENIGFYSTLELWPVPYIIINNNLTEEEIYFVILQLLQRLKINFGHTIEFIKSPQIAVYLVFEINSTKQFYSATQQIPYNSKAIQDIKALVRNVLRKRFDPPIVLVSRAKERICRLQTKSLISYLKSEHCI